MLTESDHNYIIYVLFGRFNRWGSLLAVGCNDGRVCIFDFITRQMAKVLSGHVQPVTSLRSSEYV